MTFDEFFKKATGHGAPFDYQRRLACGERDGMANDAWIEGGTECKSMLVSIPTGLGKRTLPRITTNLNNEFST